MSHPPAATPPVPAEPPPPRLPPAPAAEPDAAWLLVLRHGQSEWNAQRRGHGWGNPPLSPLGVRQAEEAAQYLTSYPLDNGIDASDLERARQTAQILTGHLNIGPVTGHWQLREHNIGEWDGLTWEEIEQRWPGARQAWINEHWERPPGGESLAEFRDRVREITYAITASSIGLRRLVVAHGGVVRALEHLAGIEPQAIDFLSGRWFRAATTSLTAGPRCTMPQPAAADL